MPQLSAKLDRRKIVQSKHKLLRVEDYQSFGSELFAVRRRRRISICISKPRLMRFWSSIIWSSRAHQPPPWCHWHLDKSKIGDGSSHQPLFGFHQNVKFRVEWLTWQVTQRVIIFWWAEFVTNTLGMSQCWLAKSILGLVTPVLWRGSNFSNWNVTRPWWYKPVSRRERVMTNCWSMTITGQ